LNKRIIFTLMIVGALSSIFFIAEAAELEPLDPPNQGFQIFPDWIKTSFKFWAAGHTSDTDLKNALQFLIKEKILDVSNSNFGCVGSGCGSVQSDNDNDGIPTSSDNCPDVFNPNQEDSDGDGMGDLCDDRTQSDPDSDGAKIYDSMDNCPTIPNAA